MGTPNGFGSRRKSSTPHYQTFPTSPPKSKGAPRAESQEDDPLIDPSSNSHESYHTPLPTKQLAILAIIALAEQTALNSISPYLPDMASTFPEVDPEQVGVDVGTIASAFALAQFATNFFWGWLSDRVGRKPVILTGTLLTAACFVAFGFCRTLWQAIVIQALMGLVNGNQGVVSTCLGEITDRSNQSKAFQYLPVIYGIGGITGPIMGGLLVFSRNPFNRSEPNPYPYLLPNLVSAAILIVDLIIAMLYLEESLEEARSLPPLGRRISSLFAWLWQFTSSTRPNYMRIARRRHWISSRKARRSSTETATIDGSYDDDDDVDDNSDESSASPDQVSLSNMLPHQVEHLTSKEVLNRDTILLLVTYLIFQLSNVSYNSLYPIFAQAPPPTGRSLSPQEIGLSLAFAGLVTILFQVGIFGKLREQLGNKATYRVGFGGFVIAYMMMPWVGYKDPDSGTAGMSVGKLWLWIELGVVLLIKTVAAVGGLTSALLLITNSAPDHAVLGTLNGLAQTLSAAGRAVGPFLSGGLFTIATKVKPKGEALAFGVFGGISFIGLLMSFGIRGEELEAEWDEENESEGSENEGDGGNV
ncbi:MAG: hypothetical protein M1834_005380 [Cirrosporium novae-zelandiae]|nr:MAG: hypothetical protein M1834_005380 [Cirrosporium novae-zelandiae]